MHTGKPTQIRSLLFVLLEVISAPCMCTPSLSSSVSPAALWVPWGPRPWMLCYKGAAFVFPPEHQVLLAVTVLHPNFADVLKHFWVLVTVQKGRVVWYFSTSMNKIMCSGTVEGASRQDGFWWGRKRWLGWEIRGWDGACHSPVNLLPMERFLGQLLGFGSSERMEPNPKVRWGANE